MTSPPEIQVISLPGLAAGSGDGTIVYRPLEAVDFEIWTLAFTLATDITVATRLPFLQIAGQNRICDIAQDLNTGQAASLGRQWSFVAGLYGSGGRDVNGIGQVRFIVYMPVVVIPAGYNLNIAADGAQAGDVWSSVFLTGRYRRRDPYG